MTLRMCGIKYKHKLYGLTPRNQNGKQSGRPYKGEHIDHGE